MRSRIVVAPETLHTALGAYYTRAGQVSNPDIPSLLSLAPNRKASRTLPARYITTGDR
jgi:hypothetical protein